MFLTKGFILKFIPVAITGSYLMWLIYFMMDKSNMRDANILIVQIGLFQLTILGLWIYFSSYRNWHRAKKLLINGISSDARVINIVPVTIHSVKFLKLTYQFNDHLGKTYSRTPYHSKKQFDKWFNNIIPATGDKVEVFYDPHHPENNMLSQEMAYGKTSSKF